MRPWVWDDAFEVIYNIPPHVERGLISKSLHHDSP